MRTVALVAATLICFLSAALTSRALERTRPAPAAGAELMYFPSGKLLSVAALGDGLLAADLVWLRGLQYYGEHRLTDQRYDHIGHIFDVATALDPHFLNAYVFGALVLAGEGGDVEGAIAFLKQGLARNPDSYLLAFEIGFLYYVELQDMGRAAYYYRRALRAVDCPEYVRRFAAAACERSRRRERALDLWEDLARTSRSPAIRRLAEERARELRRAPIEEAAD